MLRITAILVLAFVCLSSSAFGFVPAGNASHGGSSAGTSSMTKKANTAPLQSAASSAADVSAEALYDPSQRDAHYAGNVAKYLCDLHDTKSTFDFCGGMMFQREYDVLIVPH